MNPVPQPGQGRRGGRGATSGLRGQRRISVQIEEQVTETYRQERRGRPGEKTRDLREERLRFTLRHHIELKRLDEEARCDGIFPLVSNDCAMTERELLLAYKQQPAIERRFE